MYWYESIYLSDSVLGREKEIIDKLNSGSIFNTAYFVCLSSNQKNLFDIVSARELGQKGYPKKNIHILGICGSKDEAIELVAGLIQKAIKEDGTINRQKIIDGKWRDSFDFS